MLSFIAHPSEQSRDRISMRSGDVQKGVVTMEIMLHLGAHRSASTTFQSFLWANRARLAQRGLTCWTPKRTRNGLMRGLMRHPAMITLEDERKGFRSVGRIRLEIERLSRSGQKGLLISEENMIGSMSNNLADTRLYPLVRERLMRFSPAFAGREVRIGLCVRSYEDYWTSCFANLMARGRARPSVDQLDFLTTQPRRWRSVVRDIAAVFPDAKVFVWPFERMANEPADILRFFWPNSANGLDGCDVWRNRSPKLVDLDDSMALRGEASLQGKPMSADARWMPFDEDQRAVLRAEYRRDLSWLMAGAEGLATYVDGRDALMRAGSNRYATTPKSMNGNRRQTPVPSPDRGEDTYNAQNAHVPFGGHNYDIEERLGRAGAT